MISFTSFLSNHAVVQTLQRAASPAGRLSHAYLLHGTKGLGKRTLARIFAAGLLCGADERPCGQCNSCHKVEKESHPDLMVLRRRLILNGNLSLLLGTCCAGLRQIMEQPV